MKSISKISQSAFKRALFTAKNATMPKTTLNGNPNVANIAKEMKQGFKDGVKTTVKVKRDEVKDEFKDLTKEALSESGKKFVEGFKSEINKQSNESLQPEHIINEAVETFNKKSSTIRESLLRASGQENVTPVKRNTTLKAFDFLANISTSLSPEEHKETIADSAAKVTAAVDTLFSDSVKISGKMAFSLGKTVGKTALDISDKALETSQSIKDGIQSTSQNVQAKIRERTESIKIDLEKIKNNYLENERNSSETRNIPNNKPTKKSDLYVG